MLQMKVISAVFAGIMAVVSTLLSIGATQEEECTNSFLGQVVTGAKSCMAAQQEAMHIYFLVLILIAAGCVAVALGKGK